MTTNPTIPDDPRDNEKAIEAFFDGLGLRPAGGGLAGVGDLVQAFSRLPYENVSKILKTRQEGGPEQWRRRPLEVIEDHLAFGLGGTCYSLTHFLRVILARDGRRALPVLADMPNAPDRHCALVIEQNGQPYLLDPGYLINEPLRLPDTETRLMTPRGELLLVRNHQAERMDLFSLSPDGSRKLRYSLKPRPVDDATFLDRWRASFSWPQMNQLLITRHIPEGQLYLHNRHLRRIADSEPQARTLSREELVGQTATTFGIAAEKIAAARELINSRRPKRKI